MHINNKDEKRWIFLQNIKKNIHDIKVLFYMASNINV